MADRKSVLKAPPERPELDELLAQSRAMPVTDEQLHEQRVSFVYGNAPEDSGITRDSARKAAERMRLSD